MYFLAIAAGGLEESVSESVQRFLSGELLPSDIKKFPISWWSKLSWPPKPEFRS